MDSPRTSNSSQDMAKSIATGLALNPEILNNNTNLPMATAVSSDPPVYGSSYGEY